MSWLAGCQRLAMQRNDEPLFPACLPNTTPRMPLDFHIAEGLNTGTGSSPVLRLELVDYVALFSGFKRGAYPGALRRLSDYYSDADFSGALLQQLIRELGEFTPTSAHSAPARRVASQLLEIAGLAQAAGHVLRAVAD